MKRTVLTFFYALAGLMVGIFLSTPLVTHDAVCKLILRNQLLDYFQRMYTCTASANLQNINLLQGTILLTDIKVRPIEVTDDWHWHSNQCTIAISPFAWFFTKSIPVHLAFDMFTIHTRYQNRSCNIIPHFQQLFKVPETSTPFFVHQLSLAKLYTYVYDEHQTKIAHLQATFEMLWQNNTIENRLIIADATITFPNVVPIQLQGSAHASIFNPLGNNIIKSSFNVDLSFIYLHQSYCLNLNGDWDNNIGLIHLLYNGLELVNIEIQADGSFNARSGTQLHQLIPFPIPSIINLSTQGNIYDATRSIAYGQWRATNCPLQVKSVWQMANRFIYSMLNAQYQDETIHILLCLDTLHQQAFVFLCNPTQLSIGPATCLPHHFKLLACINRHSYTVHSSVNSYMLYMQGLMDPLMNMPHGWVKNNKQPLLTFWPDPQQQALRGSFNCAHMAHPQIQASGSFDFNLQYHHPFIIINGCCTQPWFIPQLGNSITQSSAHIILDLAQQLVTLQIQSILNKGQITITNGTITKDVATIPVTLEKCFVRPDPDLYALISGNLLFTNNTKPLLQGNLTLDQCYYAKNILAAELTSQMTTQSLDIPSIASNTSLDIGITTQQPINVKTAFLTGQVHTHLQLTNSIKNPVIAGTLDIAQATLHFPYKALHVTQGSLIFLPYQPLDPFINITAKNRIKKYQVSLHAYGTVHDPSIHLEASPSLSCEQIISLLLTGSEERSLAITVPTLLMQQLQQLMFGPALANSALAHYFKKFTKPFKNVRFIPHLTDQSARGGIRAGLEINYNDKLRAYIQKNLTLTEDTLFEVEYQCTDHVSVKGIKDEHGDLGAEVEMRWKFK